jgi:hypothetical protein
MFTIHRLTKNGKLVKKVLAYGETEKLAWDMFNSRETYLYYSEYSTFDCRMNPDFIEPTK